MQDTARIERMTATPDLPAPKRSSSKNDEAFERIFNEKQQPEKTPAVDRQTRTKDVAGKADKTDRKECRDAQRQTARAEKNSAATDQAQEKTSGKEAAAKQDAVTEKSDEQTAAAVTDSVDCGDVAEQEPTVGPAEEAMQQIQQTLVKLMKVMSRQGDADDADTRDQIDSLLNDLVQQLDSTDLHGEEVLAGVDLSALADQLDELKKSADKDQLLTQLISGIENQLVVPSAEPVVTSAQVQTAPELTVAQDQPGGKAETLAQARQILQQAIDAVKAQNQTESTATEVVTAAATDPAEDTVVTGAKTAEDVDPRFAGLLNPRAEQRVAHGKQSPPAAPSAAANQVAGTPPQQTQETHGEQSAAAATEGLAAEHSLQRATDSHLTQVTEQGEKHALDGLSNQAHHVQQGQGTVAGTETAKAMPQNPVVQLASGQQVAESQIFDQVVSHLSGSVNGESGRMVLRLQPAELGSLKLDLAIEGDKISANIHAQNQQVQEVLERHLPQLRNALAEQGLKIEQFQVSVEQSGQQGQYDNLSGQQQQFGQSQQQHSRFYPEAPEEEAIPLIHLLQNGGGGISLRV